MSGQGQGPRPNATIGRGRFRRQEAPSAPVGRPNAGRGQTIPHIAVQNVQGQNVAMDISISEEIIRRCVTRLEEIERVVAPTFNIAFVIGKTGSGKSSLTPQALMRTRGPNEKIAVLVPKRIAARLLTTRLQEELGDETLVGCHIGGIVSGNVNAPLWFLTAGVLSVMLANDVRAIFNYSVIVIDEIHERNTDTEFLLAQIKKIKPVFPKMKFPKIILMSATFNPQIYLDYFVDKPDQFPVMEYVLDIGAGLNAQHPVTEWYLEDLNHLDSNVQKMIDSFESGRNSEDLKRLLFKLIDSLSNTADFSNGSILVFLSGVPQIESVFNYYEEHRSEYQVQLELLKLFGSQDESEQERTRREAEMNVGMRKVILATNIAETSITLRGLKVVINFGVNKQGDHIWDINIPKLTTDYSTRDANIQRRGRVGRTAGGLCVHLMPKLFENSPFVTTEQPLPKSDIQRLPLNNIILKMLKMGVTSYGTVPPGYLREFLNSLLSAPHEEHINFSVAYLLNMGALVYSSRPTSRDPLDNVEMTFAGQFMSTIPVESYYVDVLLRGLLTGTLQTSVIIAAEHMNNQKDAFRKTTQSLFHWNNKNRFSYDYSSDERAVVKCFRAFQNCQAVKRPDGKHKQYTRMIEDCQNESGENSREWTAADFVSINLGVIQRMDDNVQLLYSRISNQVGGHLEWPAVYRLIKDPVQKHKSIQNENLLISLVIAGHDPLNWIESHPDRYVLNDFHQWKVDKFPINSVFMSLDKKTDDFNFSLYGPYVQDKLSMNTTPVFSLVLHKEPDHEIPYVVALLEPTAEKLKFGTVEPAVIQCIQRNKVAGSRKIVLYCRPSSYAPQDPMETANATNVDKYQAFHVLNFLNPHCFGLRPFKTSSEWEAMKIIMDGLYNQIRQAPFRRTNLVKGGQKCIVLEGFDNKYSMKAHRGIIKSTIYNVREGADENEIEVLVHTLDQGVCLWYKFKQISLYHSVNRNYGVPDLFSKPPLAFRCSLVSIQPPAAGHEWDFYTRAKMLDHLKRSGTNLNHEEQFAAKVYVDSVQDGAITKNYIECNDLLAYRNKTSFVFWCTKEGLAKKCPRLKLELPAALEPSTSTCLNVLSRRPFTDPFSENTATKEYSFRDIHSPIVVDFRPVINALEIATAIVDENSVNSIVLDPRLSYAKGASVEPKLLIAHNLRYSEKNEQLYVSRTTLMPPIPGLKILLALVFCPVVSLVRKGSNIIGIRVFQKRHNVSAVEVFKEPVRFFIEPPDVNILVDLRKIKNDLYVHGYEAIRNNQQNYIVRLCDFFWTPRQHQMMIEKSEMSNLPSNIIINPSGRFMENLIEEEI